MILFEGYIWVNFYRVKMETRSAKDDNEENIPMGREGWSFLLDSPSSWGHLDHFLCHHHTILKKYWSYFSFGLPPVWGIIYLSRILLIDIQPPSTIDPWPAYALPFRFWFLLWKPVSFQHEGVCSFRGDQPCLETMCLYLGTLTECNSTVSKFTGYTLKWKKGCLISF